MEWTQELNGHNTQIAEIITPNKGVSGLLARCLSCRGVLGSFSMNDYPKYRLAMAAAREVITTHVARPLDDQDGVW
jgi:hypothetical protein